MRRNRCALEFGPGKRGDSPARKAARANSTRTNMLFADEAADHLGAETRHEIVERLHRARSLSNIDAAQRRCSPRSEV
jgi:hypothetical protein